MAASSAAASPWQIRDGCLMVRDKVVLSKVAPNITLTPSKDGAAFVGATSRSSSSRHVFNIGVLRWASTFSTTLYGRCMMKTVRISWDAKKQVNHFLLVHYFSLHSSDRVVCYRK